MTDPRQSENQDDKLLPAEQTDKLLLTEMRRRGFFDDVPTGDDFFGADDQPHLGWETADAQHIVAAIDRLTEQLHLANLIAWQLGTAENYEREIRKGLDL